MNKKFYYWILAIRPKTLPASIAPILMGCAIAYGDGVLHVPTALVCLVTAIALQIGANLSNDYYDFVKGSDFAGRKGPLRVTQSGLISQRAVRIGFIVAFAVAGAGWLALAHRAGWPILLCGACAIGAGILYTAGPRPLGYVGLGDSAVFLFFGPAAVAGCFYAQALFVNVSSLLAGVCAGLLSVAVLTVNNLRDIDGDRISGKRTLAVRWGASFARVEYVASVCIGSLLPAIMVLGNPKKPWILLSCLTLPVAAPVIKTVLAKDSGPELNKALADTGKALFLFAILFSIGWIL